ncbi:MAG: hypothetical protein GY711_34845 [bacterium]|nr:hypothetical protein [bacterium]
MTAAAPSSDADVTTVTTERDWSWLGIGPNDVLRVHFIGHPELSSPQDGIRVDPQGFLYLPLIGKYDAAGKSLSRINEEVEAAYGEFVLEPHVSTSVVSYDSRDYYVLGHISEPGRKRMDRQINALEALSTGGHYVRGADRKNVFLIRPHGDRIEVHLFNARTPDAGGLVQLLPGDIVFVRQTGVDDFQEDILPILSGLGFTTRNVVETPLIR